MRADHARNIQQALNVHVEDIKRQFGYLMKSAFPDKLDAQEPNANMSYIEKQCLLDVVEMRRKSSTFLIGELNRLVQDLESKLNEDHHLPPAPPPPAWAEGEE